MKILLFLLFIASCGKDLNLKKDDGPIPDPCLEAEIEEEITSSAAILVVGDSISIGYTSKLKELLPDYQVVHNSCNAENSNNGREKIEKWADRGITWKACTFNHGLWDIKDGVTYVSLDDYISNLEHEISVLEQHCEKVIFVNTTRVYEGIPSPRKNSDVDLYNSAAKELMNNNNIPVCDLNSHSYGLEFFMPDAVHYDKTGYSILAVHMRDCINSL